MNRDTLSTMAGMEIIPEIYRQACRSLLTFTAKRKSAVVDFSPDNFMRRGEQLVFNDVVTCAKAIWE